MPSQLTEANSLYTFSPTKTLCWEHTHTHRKGPLRVVLSVPEALHPRLFAALGALLDPASLHPLDD